MNYSTLKQSGHPFTSVFQTDVEITESATNNSPYRWQTEVAAWRRGEITLEGLLFNLETGLLEVLRSPLGRDYEMYLDGNGELNSPGFLLSAKKRADPARQRDAISRGRAPYDIRSIEQLEAAIKATDFDPDFFRSYLLISPTLVENSGFMMIENGEWTYNERGSKVMKARRLAIPIDQFLSTISDQELTIRLALSLSKGDSRFKGMSDRIAVLGEVIFSRSDFDFQRLIDDTLKEVSGLSHIHYGDSIDQSDADKIIQILQTHGHLNAFVELITKNRVGKIEEELNILLNQLLDLKELSQIPNGLNDYDKVCAILKKRDAVLTRDVSGYCPTGDDDPELSAAKRRSNGAAYRCQTCREIIFFPKLICSRGHRNKNLCA